LGSSDVERRNASAAAFVEIAGELLGLSGGLIPIRGSGSRLLD